MKRQHTKRDANAHEAAVQAFLNLLARLIAREHVRQLSQQQAELTASQVVEAKQPTTQLNTTQGVSKDDHP